MNFRSFVAAALVVLFVSSTVHAQTPAVSWRTYAERVGPRTLVIVELTGGARVEGHIILVSDEAVSLLPKTRIHVPVRQLALADIQSIEVRNEGWSAGAKVLASVSAVAGVLAIITIAMLAHGY